MRVCVDNAVANEEYASSPANYAHWMLAHAYPTIIALSNYRDVTTIDVALVHGLNAELREVWGNHYGELLAPSWHLDYYDQAVVASDSSRVGIVDFDGVCEDDWCDRARRASKEFASANKHFRLKREDECDMHISLDIPHLSFCTRDYWKDVGVFSEFVREKFSPLALQDTLPDVFILLRENEGDHRRWIIDGLDAFCEKGAIDEKEGVRVTCGSFGRDTPLSEVSRILGSTRVLISPHGAGLANCVFLPLGATVFELDAVSHREFNRPFYQTYARQLGVRAEKVWLDETGQRLHFSSENETLDCRMTMVDEDSGEERRIVGKSEDALRAARILPYNHSVRIDPSLLLELIHHARLT